MRRAVGTLLTAALLVTAGCLGAPGTGEDPTTSNSPRTTTAPAPSDGASVPGVTDAGVNRSAVLAAHAAALRERGFRAETNYTVTRGGELVHTIRAETRASAGLDAIAVEANRTVGGQTTAATRWVNGTTVLSRTTGDGEPRYHGRTRGAHTATVPDLDRLSELLAGASLSVRGERTENGTRLVTLAAERVPGEATGVENRSVELVVTGAGVIRAATVTGTVEDGASLEYRYGVTRLGVSELDRPAWVASAPPLLDAEVTVDFVNCTDTYLQLVHEGREALPAGSTVAVSVNGTEHRVTLESAVDTGDGPYLYLTEGGLVASDERPAPERVVGIGDEVSVEVVTGGGFVVSSGSMGFSCASAPAEGPASGGDSTGAGSESAGAGRSTATAGSSGAAGGSHSAG